MMEAAQTLGHKSRTHKAFRRALNHTNDKAFTAVKKALAPQVGLTQTKTVELGQVRTRRANFRELSAAIKSDGSHVDLKEFGAKQFSYGVRAKPWGQSRRFEHAFIYAGTLNSGRFVREGSVFHRTSSSSLPIEKMFGPAIPEEMVKGATKDAWESKASEIEARIAHELRVITKGVVS